MGDGTIKKPYTRKDVLRLIEENGDTAEELDLAGKVFKGDSDLSQLKLNRINMNKAVLVDAHLEGAELGYAHLEEADLSGAHLQNADLSVAHLEGANLKSANLERANLSGAMLEGANLSGAKLEKADLGHAYLERANLSNARLDGADLGLANLEKAILRNAHLEGANLDRAFLFEANVTGANLERACLDNAILWEASLHRAKLDKASLKNAELQWANLEFVSLRADFRRATLWRANLMEAEFPRDANLEEVGWGDCILEEEEQGFFEEAKATYRRLKTWYTEHGIPDIAAKFYFREKEAERKGAKRRGDRIAKWFSWAFFGHGEGWKRIIIWIAACILFFALIYFFTGTLTLDAFPNSLYYSAVSFITLGYGSWMQATTGWMKGLGVFEAFLGFFMMTLLLVTFVRKWTR